MYYKYLYSYYIIFVYARKAVILQRFIKEKPPNRTMKIINPKTQYIMKHFTQTTANGLCTPPCGSSQGKSTSFNLRYSLLMPLLLLFLLIVGNSPVWADTYFKPGETIYLRVSGDCKNWYNFGGWAVIFYYAGNDNIAYGQNAYHERLWNGTGDLSSYLIRQETYSPSVSSGKSAYRITNIGAESNNERILSFTVPTDGTTCIDRFRICRLEQDVNNGYVNGAQHVVSASGAGTDKNRVYFFAWQDGDGSWETGTGATITTTTCSGGGGGDPEPEPERTISTDYRLRGDLWVYDNSGNWAGAGHNPEITLKSYKETDGTYTFSYIAPVAPKNRFTVMIGGGADKTASLADGSSSGVTTNSSKYIFDVTSSPKQVDITYYPSTEKAKVLISNYTPVTSGWYFKCESAIGGISANTNTAMAADGTLLLENVAEGTYNFYIHDNASELYWGVNKFGGCYVDQTNSTASLISSLTTDAKFDSKQWPIKSVSDRKVKMVVDAGDAGKNIRVSFDGGKIVLTAYVPATTVTYTGKEYVFLSKMQNANSSTFDFTTANAHLFVYFWNAETSAEGWSDEAFMWDSGDNVLAAKVPAGTWTNCKIVRKDACCNGKDWNNVWNQTVDLAVEPGKNYLQTGESSVWDVYTPPFYLTGSETLCGANWGYTGNGTVNNGTVTRENIPDGTYQFKLNPTKSYDGWDHQVNADFIASSGSNVDLSSVNDKQIQFTLSEASDVTIAYDGNGVTVNATPYVPALTNEELYVFGAGGTNWVTGWSSNWDSEDYKMTISAGIASKTFYNVSGSGLRFKIRNKTAGDAQYKYDMIDAGACSGITDLGDCDNNLNICFSLAQTSDVTVYTDGTHVWLTAVPSAIVYDGTEYIFMDRRQCGYSETIAANDATCWVEFSNGSQSAGSQYPAFVCDENTLATLAPAGSWTKVRVGRGNKNSFTDGWNGWGSGNWLNITSKEYNKITAQAAGWESYSFPNSKFYLATPNNVYDSEGEWSWNGDGTLHTNSVTITLTKDQLFKFKLTRNYVAKADVRWSMEGNYTHYDATHSNLSNTECTNYSNNQIQIQLDRKSDVTIAWTNYDKIVITKTPYYNVTFDSDGGSAMDAQELRSGENATNPGTPSRGSGYTFNFWKLSGESSAYDFSTPVTSDIELVADWTAPTLYTVTFDSNGGSPVDAQEVVENETATEPADPKRDNYTFGGWKLGNVFYNFSTPVTGNIELVADWTYAPAHISSVSINESSIYTWEGDAITYTLIPTLVPADIASVTVSWSSSDNNVATVENGVITPQRAGTATITCIATDYYSGSQTATCAVKVASCAKALADAPSYSVTITGRDSYEDGDATLTGLWNESSDNTEPATLTVCNVRIGNNGGSNEYYAYDNNGTVSIEQRSSDDVDKWYRIEAATNLYYLKNVSTGKYMYVGPTNTSGSKGNGWSGNVDWYLRSVYTSATNSETDSYKFYCTKDEWKNDIIVSRADATNNTSRVQPTDFALSRQQLTNTPNVWSDVVANTVSASRGATQGGNNYKGFQSAFENIENVANPAYIQSLMNSSYYRMKENATVQANLGSALAEADVISVELYADAATSVTLCKTNGDVVATINLNADAATEYSYLVTAGTMLDGENAFIIKAADNHAGIRSITVTPMVTESPAQPDLYWTTTPVTAHLLLDGNFTYTAASSDSEGAISYASEDTNVAQVDASTGEVTPSGAGTTNITATIAADECHSAYSISYEVSFLNLQDYINTDGVNSVTLPGDYTSENIVINKPFTIDGGGHAIGNLKVENEGDLTLSSALTVADFTICAKAGNTTTPAASGQVRNATNLTVNGEAYFLYTVDPSGRVHFGWYDFTVPFRVNVMTGIAGIEDEVLNEDFVNERNYAIMEHLGEKQAAGQYAYKKFRGIMEPCRLYSITLDDDYNYNTIRFKKADGALAAGNEVTLNAYAGEAKHANWNGVGNGTLHHADVEVSTVGYIQVYQSGTKTFLPVDRGQYSLVVGSAFMIQQAGTMTLNQATHDKLLAPRRAASVQPTAIQIASEGKPFSDQLFISADETAGQGYTQGVDVAKAGNIGNVNVPQIWTNAYDSKLCAHEAQLINGQAAYALSLYAPANGTYTLTSKNIPEGYTLYLTQNGNKIWDMSDAYVIDLTKGTTNEYGLLLVERYNAPTGIENGEWTNGEAQKVLRNGVLYIIRNGEVFNAQGAVMK